ncbi:MAG: autotransporter outer membrane beta-barrel domain-containing protein, partial [Vicinamibacteria bacterium]|nr:autotransporter outer membrane beta-barrel domain-containing protein [Vicinamibacteria bacterium]
ARATGTPASGTLSPTTDQVTIRLGSQPSWTLTKTADPLTYSAAGEVIDYSYALSNTGGMEIRRIVVRDDRVAAVTCPDTTLDPGRTMTCSGRYVITAADVANRSVTNTATATGVLAAGTLAPARAQATVTFRPPLTASITIVAEASGGDATFAFTSSLPAASSLALTTADGSARRTFSDLTPGSYRFAGAELPAGWSFTGLVCSGDGGGAPTVADVAGRAASVGLDRGEAITCTFSHVFDETEHIFGTQAGIRGFLGRRMQLLAGHEPDRSRFLRGVPGSLWEGGSDAGPVDFTGSGGAFGARVSVATSLSRVAWGRAEENSGTGGIGLAAVQVVDTPAQRQAPGFDVWVESHFARSETTTGGETTHDGDFGVVYLGVDKRVKPSLLVGALVQFDWLSETAPRGGAEADGHGFMVGPYVSGRVGRALFVDARLAWGQSDNSIDPLGRYADDFATDRWLARVNLSGNWSRANFRVTPDLGLTWVRETQHGYFDALSISIPEQAVSLGRVVFGPEFAWRIGAGGGASFEPQVSIKGAWDFEAPTRGPSDGEFGAAVQAGLLATLPNDWRLRLVGTVNGIGNEGLFDYGGQLWLSVPLRRGR